MKPENSTRKKKNRSKATRYTQHPSIMTSYLTSMIPIVQCANQIIPKETENSLNPLI